MFGRIGHWELLAILGVVLLIFGPSKLPSLAKAIGKSVLELKNGLKGKSKDDVSSENVKSDKEE